MNPLTLDLYTPQLTQDVDAVATFAGELNHNEKEFIMQWQMGILYYNFLHISAKYLFTKYICPDMLFLCGKPQNRLESEVLCHISFAATQVHLFDG